MNHYSKYIQEEFNSNIILLLLNFIRFSETCSKEIKNEGEFCVNLIEIIKNTFLNEIDFITFTIFLDRIEWNKIKNDLWIKLLFLAIYTKKTASDECYSDIIIKVL